MFFYFALCLITSFAIIQTPLSAEEAIEALSSREAYEALKLPDMEAPLRYENDHELTRMLVSQTQAQLEDFEKLSEEYEHFCELEEKFMQKPQDRQLGRKLMASALILDEIISRRHLEGFFSPQLIEQVKIFAQMAKKQQSQTTLPLNPDQVQGTTDDTP